MIFLVLESTDLQKTWRHQHINNSESKIQCSLCSQLHEVREQLFNLTSNTMYFKKKLLMEKIKFSIREYLQLEPDTDVIGQKMSFIFQPELIVVFMFEKGYTQFFSIFEESNKKIAIFQLTDSITNVYALKDQSRCLTILSQYLKLGHLWIRKLLKIITSLFQRNKITDQIKLVNLLEEVQTFVKQKWQNDDCCDYNQISLKNRLIQTMVLLYFQQNILQDEAYSKFKEIFVIILKRELEYCAKLTKINQSQKIGYQFKKTTNLCQFCLSFQFQ